MLLMYEHYDVFLKHFWDEDDLISFCLLTKANLGKLQNVGVIRLMLKEALRSYKRFTDHLFFEKHLEILKWRVKYVKQLSAHNKRFIIVEKGKILAKFHRVMFALRDANGKQLPNLICRNSKGIDIREEYAIDNGYSRENYLPVVINRDDSGNVTIYRT